MKWWMHNVWDIFLMIWSESQEAHDVAEIRQHFHFLMNIVKTNNVPS